jgi:serine protease AprX
MVGDGREIGLSDFASTGRAIPPSIVEFILLGPMQDRRQLQDSPVLPDVWAAYARSPGERQDLLITPMGSLDSAVAAQTLNQRRKARGFEGSARLAYLNGLVAASLTLREMIAVAAPVTKWWADARPMVRFRLAADGDDLVRATGDILMSAAGAFIPVGAAYGAYSAVDRYFALAALLVAAEADDSEDDLNSWILRQAEDIPGLIGRLAEAFGSYDEAQPVLYQIALNRRVDAAMDRSVPAVKGDAASSLFHIDCSRLAWAVLDCGIDPDHPAFLDASGKTRVRKAYDFGRLRDVISIDAADDDALVDSLCADHSLNRRDVVRALRLIADDAENQRPIQWAVVEPLLTLPSGAKPRHHHGNHVAGIIGGRAGSGTDQPAGLCPDIGLYDFRVIGNSTEDTEFAVIGALQFIRHLNARRGFMAIHGANLSLSIPHSVRNFACGRTPVCDESERLVNAGVVVVAAAGNRGYHSFQTADGPFESYAAFSITDPGNADSVITVGATHRHSPHTYGVSFFSSRGPTGDGRMKPDLVAPGERIRSAVLGGAWDTETGTSMAAPHVSGAAAMLMARHSELIGQPARIKSVLCGSATDLGRERSFQGAGMLDVLRALQSV